MFAAYARVGHIFPSTMREEAEQILIMGVSEKYPNPFIATPNPASISGVPTVVCFEQIWFLLSSAARVSEQGSSVMAPRGPEEHRIVVSTTHHLSTFWDKP